MRTESGVDAEGRMRFHTAGHEALLLGPEDQVRLITPRLVAFLGGDSPVVVGELLPAQGPAGRLRDELRRRRDAPDGSMHQLQLAGPGGAAIYWCQHRVDGGDRLVLLALDRPRLPAPRSMPRSEVLRTLETARIGVWELDLQERRLTWSAVAEALYGAVPGTLPATPSALLRLIHPEDRTVVRAAIAQCMRKPGSSFAVEHRVRRADDKLVWLQSSGLVHFDAAGKQSRVVGTIADITHIVELQGRVQHYAQLDSLSRLIAGVVHDFRDALTSILGHAGQAILDHQATPGLIEKMEPLLAAADRAVSLTSHLLAFDRESSFQPTVLNVNEVVVETEYVLRRLIGDDVLLTTQLDRAIDRVRFDPLQLRQLLITLALHARESMPEGGRLGIRTMQAEFLAGRDASGPDLEPGRYVLLSISDDGAGMSSKERKQVFAEAGVQRRRLGLDHVLSIIANNGGHVEVDSVPGAGTTWWIYVPSSADLKRANAVEAPVGDTDGSETVLLVEDDPGVQRVVAETLRRHGYCVIAAEDGREALSLASRYGNSIDLLIADVVMPGMNGREVAEALQRHRPHVPVLFMSGYPSATLERMGVSHGCASFMAKPFLPSELVAQVRHAIDGGVPVA